MKIIAVITARSGSKSIPHKNIRDLGGIPLLGWTVKALKNSLLVDKTILSTDSEDYFRKASLYNDKIIFHKRTPELAEDVPSEQVLLDVLKKLKEFFDEDSIIVLVQPTTPFITSKDIDKCIKNLVKNPQKNTSVTVRSISEYPEWMITKKVGEENTGICDDMSGNRNVRQNLESRWILNGGAWAVRTKFLEKERKIVDNNGTLIYEMPKINSIDIDEEDDFIICESLVKSGIMHYEH